MYQIMVLTMIINLFVYKHGKKLNTLKHGSGNLNQVNENIFKMKLINNKTSIILL